MFNTLLRAWSNAATRVLAWRFTKPLARASTAVAALVFFAFVGRHALPGALADGTPSVVTVASAAQEPAPRSPAPSASVISLTAPPSAIVPETGTQGHSRASPTDPVVLNMATPEDLRRLPGIGQKRADAIAELRARLGRFRALEDLLKVKGIGRAMLKRLRPLIRLDPAPADADH